MGLSVCLSAQHLTSGVSVHPEIDITYSAYNEGQKICGAYVQAAIFHARVFNILMSMRIPAHTRIQRRGFAL